jgi:hypothetical protein
MKWVLYLSLVFVGACGINKGNSTKANKDAKHLEDSLRVHFMRMESSVYGDFVALRRFHLDLMQEIEFKDKPYPQLDSVFKILHEEADSVIIQRLHFDKVEYESVEDLLGRAQYHNVNYRFWKVRYEQIRDEHKIQRFSLRAFGEVIEERINWWNDSLEIAGTAMAICKTHLKNSGLVINTSQYIKAYQPISQMELRIKQLQASIMQLQNAESRFSDANAEEFYYTGPFIRARREILASEGILSEIALHMADIRTYQGLYFSQFN